MEFDSLTKRVAAHFGIEDVDAIAAADAGAPAQMRGRRKDRTMLPRHRRAKRCAGAVTDRGAILKPIDHDAYETVTTPKQLDDWIARAREAGRVCVDTETTSLDPMQAGLCGVSLAVGARARPVTSLAAIARATASHLGGGGEHRADDGSRCAEAPEAAAGRRQPSSRSRRI